MKRDPVSTEKAIDRLFGGSECKAAIARVLARNDGLTRELLGEIENMVREKFPADFKAMRPRFVEAVKSIHGTLVDALRDIPSMISDVEREVAASGVKAYFVGDFPREMARSGSLAGVRDVEVFAPFGGVETPGVKVHSGLRDSSMVPYMSLLGIEDSPFGRFSFSRGIGCDSLGMAVGTNEILDPSHMGVSDALAGRVATIMPPDWAHDKIPSVVFRAIRLAGRDGMSLDGRLRDALMKIENVGVPEERLVVELATMKAQGGVAAVLAELGLEA